MSSRALAILLACCLSNLPAVLGAQATTGAAPAAPAPTETRPEEPAPIAAAGAREAQAAAAKPARQGPSPAWQLATVATLVAGVGITVGGAKARDSCYDYREYEKCGKFRRKYYVIGGGLIATGATLFVWGESRSGRRPTSILVEGDRLTIQHRIGF